MHHGSPPGRFRQPPRRPLLVRLVNGIGEPLRSVGLRVPKLSARTMLRKARRRAALSDFGDPSFKEGLEVLIAAFESTNTATTFGRLFFREMCVRLLVNRLKIQDTLTRHPEILETPIRRPLIVTGLPRSGTTFFHRLLSEDPNGRPLRMWETLEITPPPTTATYDTDPRIARAEKSIKILGRLAPGLETMHAFDAQSPEECNYLFAHGFKSAILGFMFDVPDYVQWLAKQDSFASYEYMKQQLQILSWKCPGGGRWILKAPAHIFAIDALLATYPDACVVQTHRDPTQVMASLCSLASTMRVMVSDQVDRWRLGRELFEAIVQGPRMAIDARQKLDPARFFDVDYRSMIADPIATARAVYDHFGDEFAPDFEKRASRWLQANPQNKHGVHKYQLADFGLDAELVNREFADYRAWVRANVQGTSFAPI